MSEAFRPYPTLAQAADALGLADELSLRRWLSRHPRDSRGEPFCRGAGQGRVMTWSDVERVRRAREFAINDRRATHRLKLGKIYFIAGGDCIKIGFTRRPETRFAKMKVDAPIELELLHIERGTYVDEQNLPAKFAHLRVRGEWFRRTDELVAFIEERKALPP